MISREQAATLLGQDAYAKDPKRSSYLGSYSWTAGTSIKPNDYGGMAAARPELYGDELATYMRRARSHLAAMCFYGESIQLPDNRLELTGTIDNHGIPEAAIHHTFDPDALKLAAAAAREGERVMAAAGAREHWSRPPGPVHRYGGTIMGNNPNTSVTDSYGRSHDQPNLFVAGSSLFPTMGGVNPTFTLAAVALRTGDFIRANWNDLA